MRNRRPMMRELRNKARELPRGWHPSPRQSPWGARPADRSRTAPPTRKAWKPWLLEPGHDLEGVIADKCLRETGCPSRGMRVASWVADVMDSCCRSSLKARSLPQPTPSSGAPATGFSSHTRSHTPQVTSVPPRHAVDCVRESLRRMFKRVYRSCPHRRFASHRVLGLAPAAVIFGGQIWRALLPVSAVLLLRSAECLVTRQRLRSRSC